MAGNITEFTSAADSLRPSETGIDAIVQGARRAGAFYNEAATTVQQAGDQFARNVGTSIKDVGDTAVNYMAHKDVSQYNVASSALVADKAKAWNQAISGVKNPNWDGKDPNTQWIQKPLDPDDPAASKNFMDGLNGDLDKLKDSMFTEAGQDHAESHNAALRAHFQATTTADISTMAGVAAKAKTVATVNNYSNAAVSDPAGVDNYATLAANAIDNEFANHPGLKGAEGAKLAGEYKAQALKQIYQSGSMSAIQKSSNPEATAAAWSQRYPDYINGAEALTLAKAAKGQVKFNNAQDKAAQAAQKAVEHADAQTFGSNLIGQYLKPDGSFTPDQNYFKSLHDAAMPGEKHLPGLTTDQAITLFKFGQTEATKKSDDPATTTVLDQKLLNAELTPMDTAKAVVDGKLSHASAAKYNATSEAIKKYAEDDPGMKAALTAVRSRFVDTTNGPDPAGSANYSNFINSFSPAYLKAKVQGTAPDNALDMNNPNSMIRQYADRLKVTQTDRDKANAAIGKAGPTTPAPKTKSTTPEIPAVLKGIGALGWSPSKKLFYDQSTGKSYRPDGSPNE